MSEQNEKFIGVLKDMHMQILRDFVNAEDPLTRCELAKGFLEIGDYLSKQWLATLKSFGYNFTIIDLFLLFGFNER